MTACRPNGTNRQLFSIYVIELSDGSLYVGVTANLKARLAQHRGCGGCGARGGGHRHGRMRRYRRDLSPRQVCATRQRAEGIERRTAARLRARGFNVKQG